MKNEWTTYLESIGIRDLFFERVEEVVDFYEQVYPDQIKDIFVTEYVDKEGNRQYESVWLFSDTSVMEAKKFLEEDDFDCAPLKRQVKYWVVKKTGYDFRDQTSRSRMTLKFSLLSSVGGELKASSENCDHLKDLFLKYIVPNEMMCAVAAQQVDADDDQ